MTYSYLMSDRLAQGSKPPIGSAVPFDVIVLAAREYQPRIPGFDVIRVPLEDDFENPVSPTDRARILDVSKEVSDLVAEGYRVLVTCNQGRNRSGVIAGIAMVMLGVSNGEAISRIRRARNGLTNPFFLTMVSSYGGAL